MGCQQRACEEEKRSGYEASFVRKNNSRKRHQVLVAVCLALCSESQLQDSFLGRHQCHGTVRAGAACVDPHGSQQPGVRAAAGTEISYPSSEFP